VVIPAYNESENIEFVLNRIPKTVDDLSVGILVVVDGATDNTEEIVQQLSHKSISHMINRGGGEAIRVGCEMAIEHGGKIIVTIDADGQHQPEEIPKLVKPILDGDADLVNGSRIMGQYESDSSVRTIGVFLFNWLFSLLAMKRITDCSNAFRAIRAEDFLKLDLYQPQYYAAEFLLEAIKKGVRVTEIPITIKSRRTGESKKGHSIRYGWGFFKAIISTWLR
jgi:glycosyltransferase involved in cell wall biosynthesis